MNKKTTKLYPVVFVGNTRYKLKACAVNRLSYFGFGHQAQPFVAVVYVKCSHTTFITYIRCVNSNNVIGLRAMN